MCYPNCVYTKWGKRHQKIKSKNTWSAEGLGGGGGGTTTEETEERDDDLDLDLDLLVFFDFLDFPDLLDLRLPDFLRADEATGTEPNVPPNTAGVPRTPAGIVIKGATGLEGN